MSKFEKLLQKIKNLDKDLRFSEIKKVYVMMVKEAVEEAE